SNQMQLKKHGEVILPPGDEPPALRSVELWSTVNAAAADWGEEHLGDRYLRLRFEDLCNEPVSGVAAVLAFFGLDGDAERIAEDEVKRPSSFGRWRDEDPALGAALTERASAELIRFGYQSSSE